MVGSNFHLFKGDVRPEWEDAYNEKGTNTSARHCVKPAFDKVSKNYVLFYLEV